MMKSENSASIMVFAVVTSVGKVLPPHIIGAGLDLNTGEYLETCNDVPLLDSWKLLC